ncbi:hypothetical protein PAXRUDRAFT_825780 [Paxillus rubicundulus Ve08.2h10]|uniref:Translocon-associated protein subunit alpha n=1 Tax=Paxillus rubicundulus Ve08.2h10 TaxID=930991 RepID=A0A0D0DSQ4_9AGAM|nr:hypothetical protein PAXRUDRAFT_825780 [Paxillus rubicundulus Ve08.2h10]
MRPQLILAALVMALGASASPVESTEPEITVEAAFPQDNSFGRVVNGERNQIHLVVENLSDQNVTLLSVGGSFHYPESGALLKNTTSLSYGLPLLEKSKLQIPYTFYSEYESQPGDLRFNIWLEHSAGDHKYRVTAYDSIVAIVEPESYWFDFKLISTYLIVLAFLGASSYYIYLAYFLAAKTKKPKRTRSEVSAPVGTITATGAGGYQEEWIPEHHLKKPKAKKIAVAASSGDEVSGGDASTTEAKKRKNKK